MKLKTTLNQVASWGKSKLGEIPYKIKQHQTTLEMMKQKLPTQSCLLQIKQTEQSLGELLKHEEIW